MKRTLITLALWVLCAVVVGGVCSFVYMVIVSNEELYP